MVVNQGQDYSQEKIPSSIEKCQELAKGIFHESSDIIIQTFKTTIKEAMVVYVDGLVNKDLLDRDFIMPLKSHEFDGEIALAMKSHFKEVYDIPTFVGEVLQGNTAIFYEGSKSIYIVDIKQWDKRTVEVPDMESVTRGPREGFTESIRTNTALLRRKIRTPKLIIDNVIAGRQSNTPIGIAYIEGIVNREVLQEVRRRISTIDTDAVLESGNIEQYDEGIQPVVGVAELVECEAKASNNTATGSGSSTGSQGSSDSQGGDEKSYRIAYEGLAAFKDGKLVGYMDGIEARAYNFITNNINTAVLSTPSGDNFSVALVNDSAAEIKVAVKDGQVEIEVIVKTSLSLVQEGGDIDVSMIEPLKTVERDFNELLVKELTAAITKAQTEFQSDIFGFGIAMHRQHPEIWSEIKANWDDYFARASISVTVESSIDRSGAIKQPFRQVN